MKNLPPMFCEKMLGLLGEREYGEFIAALSHDRVYGLRINTLKTNAVFVRDKLKCFKEPVPWCRDGYYYGYDNNERPSLSPFYHAGLFYLQEPSAMLPASLLEVDPGDKVLDVCAAPGGKTTHIAARLNGSGVIVSNDISAPRCSALIRNVEAMGITNCVVTNEGSEGLKRAFPHWFDKILIDAPCSGEGMFRKDPSAAAAWTAHKPEACRHAQRSILRDCAEMLKPGGLMSYSTCTFNTAENEEAIAEFLRERGDFELIPIEHGKYGISHGISDDIALKGTARIFPHRQKGEGHFLAILRKIGGRTVSGETARAYKTNRPNNITAFREFSKNYLKGLFYDESRLELRKNSLYFLPEELPSLDGVRVRRVGLYLGELREKYFKPSHALAMSLKREEFANTVGFPAESAEVRDYLSGLSFDIDSGAEGYCLFCCETYPLGFGKIQYGRMKNMKG